MAYAPTSINRKASVILVYLLLTCSPLLLAWGDTIPVWVKQKKAALQAVEPQNKQLAEQTLTSDALLGSHFNGLH